MDGPFDPARPSILFDLEMTAWDGSMAAGWGRPGEWREVIQIGAVRLGAGPDLPEQACFSCLVRPVRNPVLSDYITDLTGITQQAIERDGVPYPQAQAAFDAFIGEDGRAVYSNGADDQILAENARWHGIPPTRHRPRMVNCRQHLADLLGVGATAFSSVDVAALAGSEHAGSAQRHDALSDARAIAAGLRTLIARGLL